MIVLCLEGGDPTLNLALEDHLCRTMQPDHPGWLLLWCNGPSIIVGRFQNTVAEVNADYVAAHQLPVVRRMTGGGAVYHDPGNLNFSFIVPVPRAGCETVPPFANLSFRGFLQPLVEALYTVGVEAEISGRNDLLVSGAKFSGSAQRRTSHAVLHHGTVLVDVDMEVLGQALTGDPDKYRSKGLASVRSRVTNLKPHLPAGVDMPAIMEAIVRRFASRPGVPTAADMMAAQALAEHKYRTWAWNYGHSPRFDEVRRQRFAWGMVERCLSVEQGQISACRIYGDFFGAADMQELEARFIGQPHRQDALHTALRLVPLKAWFSGCEDATMRDFLSRVG